MTVECLSLDAPLAYLACAGIMDVLPRSGPIREPRILHVHAGGPYGEERGWMLCGDLPLPLYNDFVDLISDRNPASRGLYWEIGADGKARLRPDVELDEVSRREYAFVEALRRRARAGKPLWISQALVGTVHVVASLRSGVGGPDDRGAGYPSPWAEEGSWNWLLAEARLFEEPIRGVRGRPGVFKVELPSSREERGLPRANEGT